LQARGGTRALYENKQKASGNSFLALEIDPHGAIPGSEAKSVSSLYHAARRVAGQTLDAARPVTSARKTVPNTEGESGRGCEEN
jgi:hypothetical protein